MDQATASHKTGGPVPHVTRIGWISIGHMLKPLLGGGFLVVLIAGLDILVYLKSIGRQDLTQYALGSKEAIALVFCVAIFVAALYIFSFFSSLVATHAALDSYADIADISPCYKILVPLLHALWLAMVGLFFYFPGSSAEARSVWMVSGAAAFIVISVVSASVVPSIFRRSRSLGPGLQTNAAKNIAKRIDFGFFVALSAVMSTTAVIFFVSINPQVGESPLGLSTMLLVVAVALPGALTSSLLTILCIRGKDMRKARRWTGFTVIGIVGMAVIVVPGLTIYPIGMHALRIAGVVSTDLRTYLLEDGDISIARTLGFSEPRPDLKAVQAYAWFRLGDRAILCTRAPDLFDRRHSLSPLACPIEPACMDVPGDKLRLIR